MFTDNIAGRRPTVTTEAVGMLSSSKPTTNREAVMPAMASGMSTRGCRNTPHKKDIPGSVVDVHVDEEDSRPDESVRIYSVPAE